MTTQGTVPIKPIVTILIPASELAPGEISTIRNKFINRLVDIASGQLGVPVNKIVVRDIRPKDDLDYTYQTWNEQTGTTESAYETMSTGTGSNTADRDRWIGFLGVKCDPAPAVSLIKFNIGNSDRVIWSLASLKEDDNMVGFSPAGVVLPPSEPWTISRYVVEKAIMQHLVLKGIVVEQIGKTISP